jgi:hypothetical protein
VPVAEAETALGGAGMRTLRVVHESEGLAEVLSARKPGRPR